MLKAKIFIGEETGDKLDLPDAKFNKWIEKHPNITIKEFKYGTEDYGNHSICILYDECDVRKSSIFKIKDYGLPIYVNLNTCEFILMTSDCKEDGIDASNMVSDFDALKTLQIDYDGDIILYNEAERLFSHRVGDTVYSTDMAAVIREEYR